MAQMSHSRVECFHNCPFKFYLRYKMKLNTLPTDDASSPLNLGLAIHTGVEKDVDIALNEYYNSYPVITNAHIDEAIKLEYWIPKVKELIGEGIHEIEIGDEHFKGFIDFLKPVGDNVYDMYDFKYSNNIKGYMDSDQLHLYKYYFEKMHPECKIRHMYFLFVPKTTLKMKRKNKTNPKDETLQEYRKRIVDDMMNKEIQLVEIGYDANKVIRFFTQVKELIEAVDYPKNETKLCDWCEYKEFCREGLDYNII